MSEETPEQQSRLLAVLREGVSVVQMILYKEVRTGLAGNYPDQDPSYISMLAAAIINELFGSSNPAEKFIRFHKENRAVIEQELLSLAAHFPQLREPLTDALRIQVLCDNQEGEESSTVLSQANELGILIADREIPLPSTFMTAIRGLGAQYGLIIAPAPRTWSKATRPSINGKGSGERLRSRYEITWTLTPLRYGSLCRFR
jgi:hypothetical protein